MPMLVLSFLLGTMVGLGFVVSSLMFNGFDSAKELPSVKATFPKGLGEPVFVTPTPMPFTIASTWPGLEVVVVAPGAPA